jgi:hypothetical protein
VSSLGAGFAFVWLLAGRKKLSLMSAGSQFQMTSRYPGNLDRCRRCGYPRKLHGIDGNCRLTLPAPARFLAALVFVGTTLGTALWLLASNRVITVGSMAAFACLAVLIILMTALATPGRRS